MSLFPHFPTTHNTVASPFHLSIFNVGALFLSPLHALCHPAATSRTASALLLSPLCASHRTATRSKGKGMLSLSTLSDYIFSSLDLISKE
jgi:hypothetical protein